MSSIEARFSAIELLKLSEELVYTHIAVKYGVDRNTLAPNPRAYQSHASSMGKIDELFTHRKSS